LTTVPVVIAGRDHRAMCFYEPVELEPTESMTVGALAASAITRVVPVSRRKLTLDEFSGYKSGLPAVGDPPEHAIPDFMPVAAVDGRWEWWPDYRGGQHPRSSEKLCCGAVPAAREWADDRM
jgi:hypothetical protein